MRGLEWLLDGGASEESDTERDGFGSYSGEIHAMGNGFAKGFAGKEMTATERDSKRELHYFRGAWVVGRLVLIGLSAMAGSVVL